MESEFNSSDNEVINQNLSKKKTRLKKHRNVDDDLQPKLEDNNNVNEIQADNQEFNKSNRLKFIADDEEDENGKSKFIILDFIEKDDKIDYDIQKNKKMIRGNKSLAHKIFSRENIEEEEEEFIVPKTEINMTNILNRDELADDYLTPKDMKIKKTDVPERILLKFNEK